MIDSIIDFLNMGGYGFFIWIAYFIPLLLILSLLLKQKIKLAKILQKIDKND